MAAGDIHTEGGEVQKDVRQLGGWNKLKKASNLLYALWRLRLLCQEMSWVASAIRTVLAWLNNYANLLLAIITVAYVYLTWKTLKALERSSLREREAQHLADIKAQVVSPIIQWLEFVIVETLRGRHDPLIIMTAVGHEPSLHAPRQLYPPVLKIGGLSHDLYEHAMHDHFETLNKYRAFREMLEQFFGTFVDFGNKLCGVIQKLTSLAPYDGDNSKNFVQCEAVVQFCLRAMLGGNEPKFYTIPEHTGFTIVTTCYSSEVIARGPDAEIQRWLAESKKLIAKMWDAARFRETSQRTLEDAERLRDTIRQIELTYGLPKECKYVRD